MKPRVQKYGGRGVDIKLRSHTDPPKDTVFWSPQKYHPNGDPAGGFNSFVVVDDPKHGNFATPDGQRVSVISVNGIGEIRWRVEIYGDKPHYDEGSVEHFELKPYRAPA